MHRRCLKSLIGKSQPELPQKYERARQGGVLPSWRSRGGISFHLCNDLLFLLPGCRGNKQPNFPFPLFSLPFPASQAKKGNLISLFPLFTLPFPASQAEKSNLISLSLSFRCLFPLHKPRKATQFHLFLSFRCLFPLHKPRKAT